MSNIAVVGAGRVGTTLALALRGAGHSIELVIDPSEGCAQEVIDRLGAGRAFLEPVAEISRCETVIVSVPDPLISTVAQNLRPYLVPGQVICHTSGFHPAEVLQAAGIPGRYLASMHPMISIAQRFTETERYRHLCFGLEGGDIALRQAVKLVESIGGRAVSIPTEGKALYHAGCVMATSMLLAFLDQSRVIFETLGIGSEASQEMARSLAESALANMVSGRLPQALTGPVVRGDVQVVAEHIERLKRMDDSLARIYRLMGKRILLSLPSTAGGDEETRARIEKILE